MVSNIVKRLVNRGKDIFLQLKIHQIRRSIIKSKSVCPSINWYIVVFVISSLMMKAVSGFEKWCLCKGYYSSPVVANYVKESNFEEEIEEFLLCYVEEYWRYAYTTTSTIGDVFLIIAALNQNCHQLVHFWLFVKGIALIIKACSYLIKISMKSHKKTSTLQLMVFAHAIYSWYYVYTWSNKHVEPSL